MSKTFDELFNEYFGEKPKKKTTKKPRKPKNTKNKSEDIEPLFDINKMYESIVKGLEKKIDDQNKSLSGGTLSLRSMTSIDMNDVDSIKKKFGEPVSVEYFTEDGFSFEKSTYKTENGYYVMVVMKDPNDVPVPKKPKSNKPELSLQEQLDNAVKLEKYEEAAELLKKINKLKDNK